MYQITRSMYDQKGIPATLANHGQWQHSSTPPLPLTTLFTTQLNLNRSKFNQIIRFYRIIKCILDKQKQWHKDRNCNYNTDNRRLVSDGITVRPPANVTSWCQSHWHFLWIWRKACGYTKTNMMAGKNGYNLETRYLKSTVSKTVAVKGLFYNVFSTVTEWQIHPPSVKTSQK